MEILIYSEPQNKYLQNLKNGIEKEVLIRPSIVHDINRLYDALKTKFSSDIFIVFLLSTEAELNYLATSKDKLFKAPFILILSNKKKSLISKGLMLQPRYLAFTSPRFNDVCAVLKKIILKKQLYLTNA